MSSAAETAATTVMGSAISAAAEKGSKAATDKEPSKPVKMGIKVSEILLSSIMTATAIALFGTLSKKIKGRTEFISLALLVSVVASLVSAYLKIAF